MIYISIPEGFEFKQITENAITKDYFVDVSGLQKSIHLQDIIKDALRENVARQRIITLPEFTICLRRPEYKDVLYLVYAPRNNGKLATDQAVKVIDGKAIPLQQPTLFYGQTWFSQLHLPAKRLSQVLEKRDEQRLNRQHSGPSPLAT